MLRISVNDEDCRANCLLSFFFSRILSRFVSSRIMQNFFKDPWNVFDFITVIGSIIDALVLELGVSWTLFHTIEIWKRLTQTFTFEKIAREFVQCRISSIIQSSQIDKAASSRIHNQDSSMDICAIVQSTAICLSFDCHAVLHLCDYWDAGTYRYHIKLMFIFPCFSLSILTDETSWWI